jgi:manganese/iron transport system permease protein
MLGVTWRDVAEIALISGSVLMIVLAKRRDLVLYCFDPQHARAIGLPVGLLHYGLLALLSLTIVASIKAVGVILVVAMLVTPGATAFLLTRRFENMLALSAAVSIGSCVLGTLISFHIDGATGPCIVLIQSAAFVLAFLFAPGSGVLRTRSGNETGNA